MQANTVGRHHGRQESDLLEMHFEGQISEDDLKALHVVMAVYGTGHFYMVADMTRCTGLDPAARKYLAEWSKTNPLKSSSVVYGLSFATRTIVMLTLSAVKLIGGQSPELVMVKSEAEALAWVDKHRALRSPESRP